MTDRINAFYESKHRKALSVEEVALGFVRVANEVMVRPIREISVMRGYDIKAHILAAFGGAGPQHACAIARILGIGKLFIHRFSGILSAYGIGMADVVVDRQTPSSAVYGPDALKTVAIQMEQLRRQACESLAHQGFAPEAMETTAFLNLRYQGTDTAIMISRPQDNDYAAAYAWLYVRHRACDPALD